MVQSTQDKDEFEEKSSTICHYNILNKLFAKVIEQYKDSRIEVSVCPSFWFLHQINFLFIGWITMESCWKHFAESPINKLECFWFLCNCSNEAFSDFIVNFYMIAEIKRCCQYFSCCFYLLKCESNFFLKMHISYICSHLLSDQSRSQPEEWLNSINIFQAKSSNKRPYSLLLTIPFGWLMAAMTADRQYLY